MSVLPNSCPSCGMKLEWSSTGIDLYCHNINCSAKNGRQLLHFFSILNNLDGFGPKTIENLIENGYDTIPKIYNMKYGDFQDCGYKHKTIMNLGTELEESKTRELPDYRFIAALGVQDLGIGNAKKLLNHYSYDSILFDINILDIKNISGFGEIISESIYFELYERQKEISNIYDIGFNIIHEKIEVRESPITGKRICFTGKMISNRANMQSQAGEMGAISVGSVNSKTDILVCGLKVGSNKINAAKKHGTKILSEEDYFMLIK